MNDLTSKFQSNTIFSVAMESLNLELHFVLIPMLVPGHFLPMVDMARLLARRNVKVTIVTTPLNAKRVRATVERETQSGSSIHFQLVQFPNAKAGIPEGCESFDALASMDLLLNFVNAILLLQDPIEELFEKVSPTPSCIISDKYMPFVAGIAKKFKVPRITFDGMNCFSRLCDYCLKNSRVYENISKSEPFVVPGLPHRIVFKKSELPEWLTLSRGPDIDAVRQKVTESEEEAYGVVMNSVEELEPEYVKEYQKITGKKVWCIGPVSLSNGDNLDKAERGKTDSTEDEESQYLKWLDSWPARSVIYVCLGSLNRVIPEQLMELGLGLEDTKRPFIWAIREGYRREETDKLLKEDGLEERVKGRGIVIRGWVPQLLILSHTAIGAFLTHCGWNSTTEGICSGVPLVTFPLFGDQFYNEKIVVELLEIGVRVGAENALHFGEEEKHGVQVKREKVKEAIEKVMGEDEESESIRARARSYGEKANKAMEEGGSSYLNLSLLIEDVTQHVIRLKMKEAQPQQQSPNAKCLT